MDNKRCIPHVAIRRPDAKVSVFDNRAVGNCLLFCLVTGLLLVMLPALLFADAATEYTAIGSLEEQQSLSIPLNKSRVIKLPRRLGRVSVANPELVDILVINSYEIYLVGKKLGSTNAILWDKAKRVQAIIGLQVTHDLAGLKQKLHRFLPQENIQVESSQGSIVLSGEVSCPQKMGAALDLAKTFVLREGRQSGKGDESSQVLNLLQIGGAQQVLLEVKVAEISRSLVRRLDIDFNLFSAKSPWKIGSVNGGATFPDAIIEDPVLGSVRVPHFSGDGVWGPAVSEFAPAEGAIEDSGLFA
jgi:pilus assembly protein CpaC